MQSPFAIIGNAWSFYRKQPVLNEIAFWLMFLPIATLDAVFGMVETVYAQGFTVDAQDFTQFTAMELALAVPIFVVIVYFFLWGQASTLIVAKRLVLSPAGRNRTSFKAVRKQGKKYIGAIFTTEVIRSCITLLLMLLLIVPGIIYSVRTVFYDIMMIERGKVAYGRDALSKSSNLVKGHTWDIFWRAAIIGICIALPAGIVQLIISTGLTTIDPRLSTLALVFNDAIDAFTGMFIIVCLVALYSELKTVSSPRT